MSETYDDPYAWHDPFAEISQERLHRRRAERELDIVTKGFGPRLIDVWDGLAQFIVKEVAKPYAYEHGTEAIQAIAFHANVTDWRDPAQPDQITFQVNTINPIRIASRGYDDGRMSRRGGW